MFTFNNTSTNVYLFSYAFISYYVTGVVGLAVLFVSSLLGGIRFFDGAIDPAIGVFIDKLDTRFGKYRPVILLGNLITALSFIILFSIHTAPEALQIPILVVSLLVHKIGYSLQGTVTKAAQTVITNDPKQRPLYQAFDGIFNIFLFTGGQIFISEYLAPKNGGFTVGFFYELQIIAILLSAFLAVLAIIGIWEKDRTEYFGLGKDTVETKGVKEYWKMIKGNRPLQLFSVAAGTNKLALQVMGDAVVVVMIYGIFFGDYGLSGTIAAVTIIPSILVTLLCTRLAQTTGFKKTFKISTGLGVIGFASIAVFLLMLSNPQETFSSMNFAVILFIVLYVLARGFGGVPAGLAIPMTADISDYETAKSGRYVAGMIGTIFSFVDSISASFAPVLVGWVCAAMGFREVYPTVDTPFTPTIKFGTIALFAVIPALLLLISYVAMHFYALDKETMIKVQSTISEKKQASKDKKDGMGADIEPIPAPVGAAEAVPKAVKVAIK